MGKRMTVLLLILASLVGGSGKSLGDMNLSASPDGILAATKSKKVPAKKSFTRSSECATCHKDIYDSWSRSMHAQSLSDPIFDYSYAQALKLTGGAAHSFCLRCHAPIAVENKDLTLSSDLTREGVTCDICHSLNNPRPGDTKAPFTLKPGGAKLGPSKDLKSAAHATEYSPDHSKSEFCGACHELKGQNGVVIMGTYSEWKAGPYGKAGKPCQSCHMPINVNIRKVSNDGKATSRGANLHAPPGGHSEDQIKKAARVKILRRSQSGDVTTLRVAVTNAGSGHMIPTGIPSRELVLVARARDRNGKVIVEREQVFRKIVADARGRELTSDAEIMLRAASIISDNRIAPGEAREVVILLPSKQRNLSFEVTLLYRYRVVLPSVQSIEVEIGTDPKREGKKK